MSSRPSTPSRSPHLSRSASSHTPSSAGLLTPTSSRGGHQFPGTSTRPGTPLNFFATPPIKGSTMSIFASDKSLTSSSATLTSDASDVLPRPAVDPAIKGVPQGWEDDPSVPVTAPTPLETIPTQAPFPHPQHQSAFRPTPQFPPAQPHHTRLHSFRGVASLGEARSKLSTWRDKTFPELADGRRRRPEAGQPMMGSKTVGRSARGRAGMPSQGETPRPSLDFSSSTASTSGQAPRYGASVPHAHAPSTMATSVAASDENFTDLFISSHPPCSSTHSLPRPSQPSRPSFSSVSSASRLPGLDNDRQSIDSTQSTASNRNRERVMGLAPDSARSNIGVGGSKLFLPPDVNDVLPFATSRAYSAWDLPEDKAGSSTFSSSVSPVKSNMRLVKGRRTSMSLSNKSVEGLPGGRFGSASTASGLLVSRGGAEEAVEGWKDLPKPVSGTGQKRVWIGPDGQQVAAVYRVGWEKEVMDVEARLHEAMFDLGGERHTFVTTDDGQAPRTVLDIGTGLGLWPVSQALIWRDTQFVGLDLVPCQLDLASLSKAERIARPSSTGAPSEEGLWEGVEKRITWNQADFLNTLPYDTGVFDMVHLRFLSLGLSESAWPALLDEALRVLAPGGHIEIVELSTVLPPSAPASLQRSFASMLQAEMINPDPSLPIQFALPMLDGLRSGMGKPVLEKEVEGVFAEAGWAWVRSALEYKGTGIERVGGQDEGMVGRIKRGLGAAGGLWGWDEGGYDGQEAGMGENVMGRPVTETVQAEMPKVWVWVGRKKA